LAEHSARVSVSNLARTFFSFKIHSFYTKIETIAGGQTNKNWNDNNNIQVSPGHEDVIQNISIK